MRLRIAYRGGSVTVASAVPPLLAVERARLLVDTAQCRPGDRLELYRDGSDVAFCIWHVRPEGRVAVEWPGDQDTTPSQSAA